MSHRVRLALVAVFFFMWAGLILSRLWIIQVDRGPEFAERAERQHQSRIVLTPKRGTIYDREGRILAINVDVPSVYAIPDAIADPAAAARALDTLLDLDRAEIEKRLRRSASFTWLQRKIDDDLKAKIAALGLKGIDFVTESKRVYPAGRLASHVLGFVGIDNDGQAGLEYSYDKYLKGREGLMIGIRGAKQGYQFSAGKVVKEPTGGYDVTLTLDARLQYIVEEELDRQARATRSEGGIVIAMKPETGEILAMASWPDFDPNSNRRPSSLALKNRAVIDAYEPGSTFKLITAAAALEAGVVRLDDMFDCQMGSITIGSRTIRDHDDFGLLSFREVIAHSSNVGAIKVAARVGEERLWRMADAWGYGKGTGIDLPGENRGILRPVNKWSANSYGSIAIGQEVSGSPVQILLNSTVVANGGWWVKPHLVTEVRDGAGVPVFSDRVERRRIVSEQTVSLLRELTRGVVSEGGGTAAGIDGVETAGKTGTGEIAAPGRGYIPGAYLASFVGYFPVDKPRVVMAVMLIKPQGQFYGSQVAAPLFSAIGNRLATELGIERAWQEQVARRDMPASAGTRPVSDRRTWGAKRTLSQPVMALVMPDLGGLPLKEAVARLATLGVVPRVVGGGYVTRQEPAAGSPLGGPTTIWCNGTGVAH